MLLTASCTAMPSPNVRLAGLADAKSSFPAPDGSATNDAISVEPVTYLAQSQDHDAVPSSELRLGLPGVPRELVKVVLPTYRIEPPDIVQIDAIHLVPKSPYRLRTLDSLVIKAQSPIPDAPIDGIYPVEPGGVVNLGLPYGPVQVRGLTVEQAHEAIESRLKEKLTDPTVTVYLGDMGAKQQISGQHLVGPDGAVNLGGYGRVVVVGKTIAEAKQAIEAHLMQHLDEPEISVDVYAYNSKTYYVITQGAGLGDAVARFPITGNETVLDAITQVSGLSAQSSIRIWVARPGLDGYGCHQILPVNWIAVTQFADTLTNYQLLPGDRVFIAEDRLIALDTWLGKLISPAERVFGFVSLGTQTVSSIKFFHRGGSGGGFGGGF
jgi:polysaccharide export outer membrane protein